MSPLAATGWCVALALLESLCVEITEAVRPGAVSDVVNLGACQVLAVSVVVFAIVRVHAGDAPLRSSLGVRMPSVIDVVRAVAVGVGLRPGLSALSDAIAARWPYNDEAAAEAVRKLLAAPHRVALVVVAFVVIPVGREVFFRGALFEQLKRTTSAFAAGAITAVLFACSTLDPRSSPSTFVLGACLARLRFQSDSLVTAVVAHLAFWSVEAAPILRGKDPAADVTYPTRWVVYGLLAALVALALPRVSPPRQS